MGRNTAGAILIDVENSGKTPLKDIVVESLQNGKTFEPSKAWPFFIKRIGEGVLSLGENLPPDSADLSAEGYRIYKPLNSPIVFETEKGIINVSYYGLGNPPGLYDVGPLLCWNLDSRRECMELTAAMLFSIDPTRLFPPPAPKGRKTKFSLAPKDVKDCKSFTFERGSWHISGPIGFGPSCAVTFESGAHLLFNSDSLMLIEGPVSFPDVSKAPVTFDPYEDEWAGVIIRGQKEPVVIRNARFSKSNEFSYEGRRYTGALNVIDVADSSIHDNRFFDINADDALNVRGGHAKVVNNVFARNRDALDFDLGSALVEGNFMFRQKDDGIDIGSLRGLVVRNNLIVESGDKGISVGEGSTEIEIGGNRLEKNNVGVAVKDGSSVVLSGNLFKGNSLGLNVYEKIGDGKRPAIVTGASWFVENGADYKERGNIHPLERTKVSALPISVDTEKKIDQKIDAVCAVCHSGLR